jgi:F0F1-type ATP synthase membrane subunit b/b'
MNLSFASTPSFGVLIAFLGFVAFFARSAFRRLSEKIKDYQEEIKNDLSETEVLLKQAKKALVEAEMKSKEAEKEVDTLRAHMQHQVSHIQAEVEEELQRLERVTQTALKKYKHQLFSEEMRQAKQDLLQGVTDHLQKTFRQKPVAIREKTFQKLEID